MNSRKLTDAILQDSWQLLQVIEHTQFPVPLVGRHSAPCRVRCQHRRLLQNRCSPEAANVPANSHCKSLLAASWALSAYHHSSQHKHTELPTTDNIVDVFHSPVEWWNTHTGSDGPALHVNPICTSLSKIFIWAQLDHHHF